MNYWMWVLLFGKNIYFALMLDFFRWRKAVVDNVDVKHRDVRRC